MGLAHFTQLCPEQTTLTAVQEWCVAAKGTCCGICPNTLSSLGTRVGLTATIFFITAVTVYDPAEAPFNFMVGAFLALAYLVTVFQAGLTGSGISRFHAYYALFCSMGWLCPLTAASVVAPHYGYGGSHRYGQELSAYPFSMPRLLQKKSKSSKNTARPLAKRAYTSHPRSFYMRSLGNPFFGQTSGSRRHQHSPLVGRAHETVPLTAPGSTSTDTSPVIPARDPELPDAVGHSVRRSSRHSSASKPESAPTLLESFGSAGQADDWSVQRLTPAALLDDDKAFHYSSELSRPPCRRSSLSTSRIPEDEKLVEDEHRSDSRRRSRSSNVPLADTSNSQLTAVLAEHDARVAKKAMEERWRVYAMLASTLVLLVFWIFVFLFVHGDLATFRLVQADCPEPSSTRLLVGGCIAFVCIAPFVIVLCIVNLRRLFDYSRDPNDHVKMILPGSVSGVIFLLWAIILWTGYELAATPDSPLLAEAEHSATFATVLSLALCIKPILDLV
ncbi:uncharacterized protein JCM10292_007264 [Rhodotorula paludigena]|uniref:uncharacterized protein n=1 Tax=Rhodotorula paludigena TaxID=86838 RepID=UPI00316FCF0D